MTSGPIDCTSIKPGSEKKSHLPIPLSWLISHLVSLMSLFHAKLSLVCGSWDSLPDICKSRPALMTVQIYQLFYPRVPQTPPRKLPRSSSETNNQQENMWYLPGPGWREGGGGRMGEGLLRRDASSALVTRQLCNSGEAEVGEAVRSPLFTHQPHPILPNTQTLRARGR